jgi:chromosome segregation protein
VYLKSLNLKGFKSFADRTVMRFEPGLAAIVGPNGSGKSNISDAVLWVLGERNAKSLRGQSMEDVIFSGSSARKPVGVAEVELVLDNSDATLPVDFTEVSIGRRMYRNGESEYLINGALVRRMDVLDILHDSGLGSGTNSIISQGNLDSILSSRPEDRRELIEEAAGILKHKERRKKSERKLAQMDAHLARVNDITAEVERQLKPLERKAKKALMFKELDAEYRKYRLDLAVDDLRILQDQWNQILEREQASQKSANSALAALTQAEKAHDELQGRLQTTGENESSLGEDYRRARSIAESINSQCLVLRERRHSYEQELAHGVRSFENEKIQVKRVRADLEELTAQFEEVEKSFKMASTTQQRIEQNYNDRVDQRNGLRKQIDTVMAEQRSLTYRSETIQTTLDSMKEELHETQVRSEVADAQVADSQTRLTQLEQKCASLQQQVDKLESELIEAERTEQDAREKLNGALLKREQTRAEMDEMREELTQVGAQRKALEELERANEASNPVLSWLMSDDHELGSWRALTHELSVPGDLDMIVEALLGSNMHGLFVEDMDSAARFIAGLEASGETGDVVLLPEKNMFQLVDEDTFAQAEHAHRLLDKIETSKRFARGFEMLLGQVYLYDTREELFKAWQRAPHGVTLVSRDGCIVDTNGRARFFRKSEEDKANSALLRRRNLNELRTRESKLSDRFAEIRDTYDALENSLKELQIESLQASEKSANVRAQRDSTSLDLQGESQTLEALRISHDSLLKEQQRYRRYLEEAQPDSDKLKEELVQVQADLQENKKQVEEMHKLLDPVQAQVLSLSEELSDARLEKARLQEAYAYNERMVASRKQEIRNLETRSLAQEQRFKMLEAASARVEPLLTSLELLYEAVSHHVSDLEIMTRESQESQQELHKLIAESTQKVRELRISLDQQSSAASEIRVEKGRLEIKVDGAIQVIVSECETPLETALELPKIEDRTRCEQEADRLMRRIKNLGTVNPDAAYEYEQVNERYNYLLSQLQDMNNARSALARIVALIDERMIDDFVKTFEQVNANFSEIFSTLFPGGHAHLSLVDPDDLENTGVDVNAQPVGKTVKKMSLLSGGEKSMTAMALLFAVYRIRQTPFYILDEIEAALDDSNLRRLMNYLNTVRDSAQFIMITHQRRTMESADILYGVSMQADGVTKVLSQRIDQARSKED